MTRGAPFAPIAATLAHRSYRVYMAGNAVSLVGLWTQRVATGWLAWELTGSGAWLGAVAVADLCPSILVGPFAGVIDKFVQSLCAAGEYVLLLPAFFAPFSSCSIAMSLYSGLTR